MGYREDTGLCTHSAEIRYHLAILLVKLILKETQTFSVVEVFELLTSMCPLIYNTMRVTPVNQNAGVTCKKYNNWGNDLINNEKLWVAAHFGPFVGSKAPQSADWLVA